MSTLGVRLRRAREKANKTQGEVCKLLGISIGTLSGYERGYRNPDPDTLARLADIYDVSVDYLLGRTHSPDPASTSDIPAEREEFVEWAMDHISDAFFWEFKDSTDEQREALKRALEFDWEQIRRLTVQRLESQQERDRDGQ